MNKCKDCKYLNLSEKTRGGYYECTNTNRRMYDKWGGWDTVSQLKAPHSKACKTGFEPRVEEA